MYATVCLLDTPLIFKRCLIFFNSYLKVYIETWKLKSQHLELKQEDKYKVRVGQCTVCTCQPTTVYT